MFKGPHSTETKNKISKSLRGNTNSRGKALSDEHKRKLSESQKGKPKPKQKLRGPHSDETKRKIAESLKQHNELDLAGKCNCFVHSVTTWPHRHITAPEQALYDLLDSAKLEFVREKRFGNYWVDTYVPELKLVFEAYGTYWHTRPGAAEYDCERIQALEARDDIDAVIVLWDEELMA